MCSFFKDRFAYIPGSQGRNLVLKRAFHPPALIEQPRPLCAFLQSCQAHDFASQKILISLYNRSQGAYCCMSPCQKPQGQKGTPGREQTFLQNLLKIMAFATDHVASESAGSLLQACTQYLRGWDLSNVHVYTVWWISIHAMDLRSGKLFSAFDIKHRLSDRIVEDTAL